MSKKNEKKTDASTAGEKPEACLPNSFPKQIKAVASGLSDLEDEIQLGRRSAYEDADIQRFLRALLHNTREEIVPSYDPARGFVYKSVESILDQEIDAKKIAEMLERLARLGVLRKSFFDSVSACPNCGSTILTLHSTCIKCKSRQLSKTSLTEHVPCGYIGERENYSNGRCPKCGRSLNETPYVDMGRWYKCKKCGEKFEHPQFDINCKNCGETFRIEDANLAEIWKYSLSERRLKEVRQNVASLDSVSKLLKDLGFKIETPGILVGEKSGVHHNFSLSARKEISGRQYLIALDMVVSEIEVAASPVILYIYKTSEVSVDLPVFIAIPKLSGPALKAAKGRNILLIEGCPEEADNLRRLKLEIQNRLKPKGFFESLRSTVRNNERK